MKMIIALLAAASFLVTSAFAQQDATQKAQEPVKKTLTTEDVAGKTFLYIDGQWGAGTFYFRPDGTFKTCGSVTMGCDEGTWSFVDGKLARVYRTWFASRSHRPAPITLTQEGKKGMFGNLSSHVFGQEEVLPSWAPVDPRK